MSADPANRSVELQKWICGRMLDLPPSPDKLMTQLRAHVLRAKKEERLKTSRELLTDVLMTPVEILDVFIYGLRLRRKARHPRGP